jgi:regulatory protein YycI of two-component signal transduction system YycFG
MDLAKAKGVIIALLLVFNIFLLYNNLTYFKDRGVQKETIENAVAILKARGITLNCKIPTNALNTRWLIYGNKKLFDDAEIADKLLGSSNLSKENGSYEAAGKKLIFSSNSAFVYTDEKPSSKVNINDTAEAGKYARKYLENAGLLSGKYIIDAEERKKDGSIVLHFVEKYYGYLVFDNYCSVTLNNNGIIRIEYNKLQIVDLKSGSGQNQVSAYQVLLANYQKGSGQVITAMDIGYKYPEKQTMEGIETVELLPVWRITIKGMAEQEYLSAAFTDEAADPSGEMD